MTKAKTMPSRSSVDEYLASRASTDQLADCKSLVALLQRVTGEPPTMWGPSIAGFGSYPRFGKACLYFKRLADLDQKILEELVVGSLNEVRRRHG